MARCSFRRKSGNGEKKRLIILFFTAYLTFQGYLKSVIFFDCKTSGGDNKDLLIKVLLINL